MEKEIKIPIEDAVFFLRKYIPPSISLLLIPYIIYNHSIFYIEIKSSIYFYELYLALIEKKAILKVLFSPLLHFFNSFDHFGLLIILMLPSVIFHELLHALTAIIFSKGKLNTVSFGFDKKTLSPYTHCKKPLYVWQYKIVLILPGIILGILPGLLSIFISSPDLLLFGIIFSIGALGDFLVYSILNKFDTKTKIKDHPNTLGFFIVE